MKKLVLLLLIPSISFAHNVSGNIDIIDLKDMNFPNDIKRDIRSYNQNMKINGFVEKDNPYTRQIMRMRSDKRYLSNKMQQESDELKKSPSQIKTNFEFKSVLPNPIAFSGIGIVNEDGIFSGIKEFFDGHEAGMCTLSAFNIANVKEHMKLNREGLTYEVNDKPTRINIDGSQNSGFMYSVKWFDAHFAREIECANNNLNDSIKDKIISYAKLVDNSL